MLVAVFDGGGGHIPPPLPHPHLDCASTPGHTGTQPYVVVVLDKGGQVGLLVLGEEVRGEKSAHLKGQGDKA